MNGAYLGARILPWACQPFVDSQTGNTRPRANVAATAFTATWTAGGGGSITILPHYTALPVKIIGPDGGGATNAVTTSPSDWWTGSFDTGFNDLNGYFTATVMPSGGAGLKYITAYADGGWGPANTAFKI